MGYRIDAAITLSEESLITAAITEKEGLIRLESN
jgi:hypothetical protein